MISISIHGLLLLSFLIFTTVFACNSTCGTHHVPYPFGFSGDCPIFLRCNPQNTKILLPNSAGAIPIHSITTDTLLISLKPNCTRPIDTLRRLFTPNFAPTSRNAFLLTNCALSSPCTLPTTLVHTQFQLSDCGSLNNNLTCYSKTKHGAEFVEIEELRKSGCKSLFSSIWSDANSSAVAEPNETDLEVDETVVDLEIEVVELRWWLNGRCHEGADGCSKGADCVNVTSPENGQGFRCRCRNGFQGDGYLDGHGCRKVTSDRDCNSSKYINGKCSGLTKVSVLITGVATGASLALVSLASLCLCFRRKRQLTKFRKITRHHVSESSTICIPIYPYKEIQKATDSFSEDHRLGTGAYGTVYWAKLHNYDVAIKRIKHRDTGECIEQVINEIKLLSSVNNPHLVHLLGCSIENIEEQILVYEYMPNGTLCQHLQRERGDGLSWPDRVSIAKETALAIAYLHSGINPPIYHRDIKSSNILLDYNFKAKVADFGLSRFGLPESSHISTAPQGTPGYLDPQYHQSFHLSDKSDVYSFGVVLAEIITGLKVVDFCRPSNEVNLASLATDKIGKGCVDEIIDPLLKQELLHDPWTSTSIHKVAELAFRCLAYHKDMRPSMVEVSSELEQLGSTRRVSVHEFDSSNSVKKRMSNSSFLETNTGLVVKKVRFGSLGFHMLQNEPSYGSSMDLEDGSHLSTQELWSSQHSSPSSNSFQNICPRKKDSKPESRRERATLSHRKTRAIPTFQ